MRMKSSLLYLPLMQEAMEEDFSDSECDNSNSDGNNNNCSDGVQRWCWRPRLRLSIPNGGLLPTGYCSR